MIDETVAEIREMQTHSSSVVAVKATRALEELLDREFATVDEFERDLEHNAGALRRANPSHASLQTALREVRETVVGGADDVAEAKALLAETIDAVVERVDRGKSRAADNAVDRFADGTTFLTHDNSSTVLAAVERAAADGADLEAYVTEARPRYLGRKTARRLADVDGVDPHLIVDGAAGHFLPDCDRVVLGMNCIVEGRLYNRIGTYPMVAAAVREDVPVTVVGSGAKVIDDFRFENEGRPSSEVMLEPVDGVHKDNPAYDVTPVEMIDEVITDEGVREP